jgi:PKD repeat protein
MKKLLLLIALCTTFSLLRAQTVPREMVVVEITTSTFCTYCPGAAMGLEDLVSNGKRVAGIEYHNDWQGADPFKNVYSQARSTFYNPGGNPGAFFDGVLSVVGGNHTQSMYSSYLPKYNQRIAIQSPLKIEYTMSQNGLQFTFNFTITKVATLPSPNVKFHFEVTQSNIQYNWQGQTHLEYVNRLMVPSQTGTALDFTNTDVQTVSIVANIDPLWPLENIEFVGFVQNTTTKEILQAGRPVKLDFEATTPTTFCQGGTAVFSNTSIGRPGSPQWLFPGGTPSNTTAETPTITYTEPGVYDVQLITTTGLTNDTITKTGYITVSAGSVLSTPEGPEVVCTDHVFTSTYSTQGTSNTYNWELTPAEAGTITTDTSSCTINWTPEWVGIANLRVQGTNDCGIGEWTPYKEIQTKLCTGLNESQATLPLSVFPNPANASINLVMNAKTADQVSIKLINSLGKVVYFENSVNISGNTTKLINTSSLPNGAYMLKIEGDSFNASTKVNIQR